MTSVVVAGSSAPIIQAVTHLSRVAQAIEAVFLETGQRLGDALGCWQSISSSFVTLAEQFARDDIRRCIADMATVIAIAADIGRGGTMASTLGVLGELETALMAMEERLNRLRKTVAEVKLVAINAKVEAAHVDGGGVDFSVFTREIDGLAANAAEELVILGDELRILAEQTSSARRTQAAFNGSHGPELVAICRRLEDGVRTLGGQRERVGKAAATIASRSCAAGDRVAAAVSALQVGDITRQRAEHVTDALKLVADCSFWDEQSSPVLDNEERGQIMAMASGLQATQLRRAAVDLDREVGDVVANLGGLADEAGFIGALGKESFGDGSSQGRSFLEDLGAEIGRVEKLLNGYAAALAETEAVMACVSLAAAKMVEHVGAIHSIEADLKIMALNASFKCARLGDRGRTLSVIAQNLRQLAARTVEDAGGLMSGLRAVIARAEALAHGHGQDGENFEVNTAVGQLSEATGLLAAIGAEHTTALSLLAHDSARAQDLLGQAAGGMGACGEFSQRMHEVADSLTAMADAIVVDPATSEQLKHHLLSRLAGNYTMASERTLHNLFGGADQITSAPEQEGNLDDILF